MSPALAARRCVPCRGGVEPLTPQSAEAFRVAVPAWALAADASRLERRFEFRTYREAFALVARVSALAEAERHHPDVTFGWGYAAFSLTTHAIRGLHENDFILAAKIDHAARIDALVRDGVGREGQSGGTALPGRHAPAQTSASDDTPV